MGEPGTLVPQPTGAGGGWAGGQSPGCPFIAVFLGFLVLCRELGPLLRMCVAREVDSGLGIPYPVDSLEGPL